MSLAKHARLFVTIISVIALVLTTLLPIGSVAAADLGYPNHNAKDCSDQFGKYSWCVDEDNSEKFEQGEQNSSRGYAYRNCTDFVAWKLKNDNGFSMPTGYGNAVNWGSAAQVNNYEVDMKPKPGSIAWRKSGWGHVAWVESVYNDNITIQEYNYNGKGNGQTNTVSKSDFDGFIHFKDLPNSAQSSVLMNGGFEFSLVHGEDSWERSANKTHWQRRNDGTAYSGSHHLTFNGRDGNTGSVWKDVEYNGIKKGQGFMMTAFIRSASSGPTNGQARVYLRGQNPADGASVPFSANSEWIQVQVPVMATNAHNEIRIQLTSGTNSTPGVQVDGVTLTKSIFENGGFELGVGFGSEDWNRSVNKTNWQRQNTNAAYEGSHQLAFNGKGGHTGSVWKDVKQNVVRGESYVLTAAVRSNGANQTHGQARMYLRGKNPADSGRVHFTADNEWKIIQIPVMAKKAHGEIRVQFTAGTNSTPGVQVDGVTLNRTVVRNGGFELGLSYGPDWKRNSAKTSWARQNSNSAFEGNHNLAFNGIGAGDVGKVWKDTNNNITKGETREMIAFVRTNNPGVPTSGHARLFLRGQNPTDSAVVPFTAGDNWTAVRVPVMATASHDKIRVEFVTNGSTSGVQLDGVAVRTK